MNTTPSQPEPPAHADGARRAPEPLFAANPTAAALRELRGLSDTAAPPTVLRYGENPHQRAVFVGDLSNVVSVVAINPTKPRISYNNVLDIDAAVTLMADFLADGPTAAVLKHGIPCALATADSLAVAWERAIAVDTLSPFGGVAIFNTPLDAATAALVGGLYLDVVLAPDYEPGVIDMLPRKTLLRVNTWDLAPVTVRGALGGLLVHDRDMTRCEARNVDNDDNAAPTARQWKVVTETEPDLSQTIDLLYAERVCKHVKSNAVALVKDRRLVAAGAAQPCRVGAVEVALLRARTYPRPALDLSGMVMASDAYFPFPDGPTKAIEGGVVAIVQPGGSRGGDKPAIDVCNAAGVAMVFTNTRHFRH